ncbi:Xylose operon regulatory protein [Caulifigura coniformis]|uniref:Xylose operon regulatory protein n=2 Tax=Caulifigura coniformis TaxID=2527983 RepID=A0A517SIG5_9PLAN|nr:Xylose operon regulatory protein [Caulifigura coniformis]
MKKTTRVIALAVHTVNSFYRGVIRGISRRVHDHADWRVLFVRAQASVSTRRILSNVDAVITHIDQQEWCEFLIRTGIPTVNIDAVLPGLPMPRLNLDDRFIGQMAAEHFSSRGIRRFGFFGQNDLLFSQEREKAFRAAVQSIGGDLQVFDARGRQDLGPRTSLSDTFLRLCDWLRSLEYPIGLLAPWDFWALEVIEACRQLKLRVPEDVSILGVDNDELYCSVSDPSLSSVIVPAEAVGVEAVNQVERLIRERRTTLEHDILLPPIGIATRRSTDFLAIEDADVLAALNFIRDNLHRPIQVPDVLRAVSISRRSLERKVWDAVGITLGAVLRRSRLDRAKQLLVESDLPITAVSRRTGYTDLRHIELAFRQSLGVTPSAFRRNANGISPQT